MNSLASLFYCIHPRKKASAMKALLQSEHVSIAVLISICLAGNGRQCGSKGVPGGAAPLCHGCVPRCAAGSGLCGELRQAEPPGYPWGMEPPRPWPRDFHHQEMQCIMSCSSVKSNSHSSEQEGSTYKCFSPDTVKLCLRSEISSGPSVGNRPIYKSLCY